MEYTLKDKLSATELFVADLIEKSWQEIDNLQNQIANLTDTEDSKKLEQLLKNLLTSYYIFVGGLENFDSVSQEPTKATQVVAPVADEPIIVANEPEEANYDEDISLNTSIDSALSEPFEYFVDFDDPIGEPLTDKDLYN